MTKGTKTQQTETETKTEAVWALDTDFVVRKLVPGIVVNLDCHVRGGRRTFKKNHVVDRRDDGSLHETWNAGKDTDDDDEFKAADALRQEVQRKVKNLGLKTAVGLLVPIMRQKDLFALLVKCREKVNAFNHGVDAIPGVDGQPGVEAKPGSKTCDIVYRHWLGEIQGGDQAALASVSDTLDDILQQVQKASLADDESVLVHATRGDMGDEYKNAAAVLAAPADERRVIVARVRARMARNAIKEAANFSSLLPEETGRQVDGLIVEIRKNAKAWVKASKKDAESYEAALSAVPTEGISAMQAALVMAANNADAEIEANAVGVANGILQFGSNLGGLDEAAVGAEGEAVGSAPSLVGALALDTDTDTDTDES